MSRSRLWFLLRCLVAAGILLALWAGAGAWAMYANLVLVAVAVLSPLVTGNTVEIIPTGEGLKAFFVGAAGRVEVPMNLKETLIGVVLFLALAIASWGRRSPQLLLQATVAGLAILYVVQVAVVTMLPLMVTEHAPWVSNLIDVVFSFAVLGGLVALPFLLWFVWLGQTPVQPPGR